jgi:uncharacterized surface protein with fasciclin (FAS1) repeats
VDALLADPSGALTDVLLYHVVGASVASGDLTNGQFATTINGDSVVVTISGTDVFINNAQVTSADITTDNGIVHVIDAVLVPGSTVYEVVAGSPDHGTLEAAVTTAGLQGALSGPGPFTVFAPTDAAFAALPAGVVDALLADPSGALTDVLLYHVVGASVASGDLTNGQFATTLNGDSVMVTISGTDVFINNAQVTFADITTDNGIVHVIDMVLMPYSTVMDVIAESPDHTTLETALVTAGLDGTLSGPGPFTVFAPTDAAFAALPAGVVDALLADPSGALTDVLLYHVVGASVTSGDLTNGQFATTINGDSVVVTISGTDIFINNAQVTSADIMTNNGIVHVIDAVLIPGSTVYEVVAGSPDHGTLEVAVTTAGLQGTLSGPGPFTVFAPTDAAFAALPAGVVDALLADPSGALTDVLLYHVVGASVASGDLTNGQFATTIYGDSVVVTISGTDVFINNAQVTSADITTDNGIVHVIDAVLVPGSTVYEVVAGSPDHGTLEVAVTTAGLQGTLSGPGPFTVFAPTDAAFDALPDGFVDALLADPSGALTDVLLYHVLGSIVLSTDLSNGMTATTLQGDDITVTISGDDIFINDAQVTAADIETDNGVVHVIDGVLTPSTGVQEMILDAVDLSVYPNPASDQVYVRYEVVRPSEITIKMYDMVGQQVLIKELGFIYEGVQTEELTLSELNTGMYLLVIDSGESRIVTKVKIEK